MSSCSTGIDWASKPEPWNEIGPRFRAACDAIVSGDAPAQPPVALGRPRPVARPDLRKRAKALGISADQIAQEIGISRGTVLRFFKGEHRIRPSWIDQIIAIIEREEERCG